MKYHEPKIITEDLYDAELGGISLFNTASQCRYNTSVYPYPNHNTCKDNKEN